MKNKILTLSDTSGDICLIGIACHLKDYRFCWLLNTHLETDLRKIHDFFPDFDKEKGSEHAFPFYYCAENIRFETYYLLSNHSAGGDLLDKYSQVDYLLFIQDLAYPSGGRGMVQEIRKIPQVLTAFEIQMRDLREANNLITGLEICQLEYQQEFRNKKPLLEQ